MIDIDDMVTTAVYSHPTSVDATYIDASGAETAIRVIPEREAGDMVIGAEIGVRGVQRQFSMLKTALSHRPQEGEQIIYKGERYCVAALAAVHPVHDTDWLIDVR